MSFGEFFKERRLALGKSLRRFCVENGIDPSNLSKLERGLIPPPQEEKLREYAGNLELKKGSDEWYEFFDRAAAENGRVPSDLLESQIADRLPVFFRTLRDSAKSGGSDSIALLEEIKSKVRTA